MIIGNEKDLTISIVLNGKVLYKIQCNNEIHYYVSLHYIKGGSS